MDKDLFIARYESLRRRHRMVVIVALLPFFGALVWFLFLTNYPTRLVQSFAAVTAGLLVAALCFGGIWATELAIPILLRVSSLVCPGCGCPPRHRWINRELALESTCKGCGAEIFSDDMATVGAK